MVWATSGKTGAEALKSKYIGRLFEGLLCIRLVYLMGGEVASTVSHC